MYEKLGFILTTLDLALWNEETSPSIICALEERFDRENELIVKERGQELSYLNVTREKETIESVSQNDTGPIVNDSASYLIAKRTIDILGSLLGMIVLLPLFVLVAILIKLEDPTGSALFKQKRVGKNGKEFYMYKFRSMVTNAEELLDSLMHRNETTGAMFKIKEDPRVTKIGRFIRRTSIDELPQLWNVLKGEMSLVGPRPPLPREVKQYTNYDKQRLLVVPGCTGLWQISGRSNLGFNDMVRLDLEYIQKRTLLFDIIIILKTVRCMLISNNAY